MASVLDSDLVEVATVDQLSGQVRGPTQPEDKGHAVVDGTYEVILPPFVSSG